MRADYSEKNFKAVREWADELACPACLCALRMDETAMVCAVCGRAYPVVDGIAVLIVERAMKPGNVR
jgi:uncharacterized protein YbaR (Trm112 family)